MAGASIRLMLADLGGIETGRDHGNQRRFQCPIHGGDGYSLAICDQGELVGVGHCHNATCDGHSTPVVILDYPGRTNKPGTTPRSQSVAEQARALLTPRPARPVNENPPGKDATAITYHWQRCRDRASDERASAYLAGRGLDPDPAWLTIYGIGYVPDVPLTHSFAPLANMRDRLIAPLWTPKGTAYIGRALKYWEPGMDEVTHKAILEEHNEDRWRKTTGIAGWFGVAGDELAETVIIVEGFFDRLALLATGADPKEVIALAGTECRTEWIGRQVRRAILALDGDTAGQTASDTLARKLRADGIVVAIAVMPDDGLGKDASERYRRAGVAGVKYILDAHTPPAASVPVTPYEPPIPYRNIAPLPPVLALDELPPDDQRESCRLPMADREQRWIDAGYAPDVASRYAGMYNWVPLKR